MFLPDQHELVASGICFLNLREVIGSDLLSWKEIWFLPPLSEY